MMRDTSNKRHSVANSEVQCKISEGWTLCKTTSVGKSRNKSKLHLDFECHAFDPFNFINVYNVELKR